MGLLEPREGRTQLQVLSAIAYLQEEKGIEPRVKDITDVVSISKGAVSNNCKKLLDQGFITETKKNFELDRGHLLSAYREHLEEYLIREPDSELFPDEVQRKNEARTHAKKNLHGWFKNQTFKDMILEILVQSLLAVRRQSHLQTLREVFFYADDLVQKTHERIEEEMWEGKQKGSGGEIREAFDYLAKSLNWGTSELDPVFQTMSEGTQIFEGGELRAEIKEKIDLFCEKHDVGRMFLFGSVTTEDFSPTSDVNVIVEFEEGKSVGWDIVSIERGLGDIFHRKVDLVTEGGMSADYKDRVMNKAELLYEAARSRSS